MKCSEIRRLLSEYVDDALDDRTRGVVENHLADCPWCGSVIEFLETLDSEFAALESVKAPDDFLDRLHERMASGFSFGKRIRKLFVPFKIKIPLQFAAAAAMGVLIFVFIQTPAVKESAQKETAAISLEKDQTTVRKKVAAPVLEPAAEEEVVDREFSPAAPAPAVKESAKKEVAAISLETNHGKVRKKAASPVLEPAGREEVADGASPGVTSTSAARPGIPTAPPIVVTVALKTGESLKDETPVSSLGSSAPAAPMKRTPREPAERKTRQANDKTGPASFVSRDLDEAVPKGAVKEERFAEEPREALYSKKARKPRDKAGPTFYSPEEAIARVRDLVNTMDGKVFSMTYKKETGLPETLIAEIPADLHTRFCEELKKSGLLKTPPPPPAAGNNRILVPIEFRFTNVDP